MTDYSLEARQRTNRRLDRRNKAKERRQERAKRVLEQMKNGAVLCRLNRPHRTSWSLVHKGGSEFLTHEVVTDALASDRLVGTGDSLFGDDALSQTFRWSE